ncbi:hypothetical protein TRVA0_044S00738 [Trichomonascus vanleenenianus]|uniref:uncharacterized protein n=1 Tax=Trichomonascus vanleenenianus TaxID=2268995 RepID=UPI003ECA2230
MLDRLPPELVGLVLENARYDIAAVGETNRYLREAASYDALWDSVVEYQLGRIQARREDFASPVRREIFYELKRTTGHVKRLLAECSSNNRVDRARDILRYGILARDHLFNVVYPTTTSEAVLGGDEGRVICAEKLLGLVRVQQTLCNLREADRTALDFFVAFDGFHESHVLNPTKHQLLGEVDKVLSQLEGITNCTENVRRIRPTAVGLARALFSGQFAKFRTPQTTGRFLTDFLDYNMPCNDAVNICIYTYAASQYGLRVSPVMLTQNGRYIDSNFARVEDPTLDDGYFFINVMNQMIISGRDLAEMLTVQRTINVIPGEPSLRHVVKSALSPRQKAPQYKCYADYLMTAYAHLATLVLLCDPTDEEFNDLASSLRPKNGAYEPLCRRDIEAAVEENRIPDFIMTEMMTTTN